MLAYKGIAFPPTISPPCLWLVMDTIPAEIIVQIIGYLSPFDVLTLSETSKDLHGICTNESSYWRQFVVLTPYLPRQHAFVAILRNFPYIIIKRLIEHKELLGTNAHLELLELLSLAKSCQPPHRRRSFTHLNKFLLSAVCRNRFLESHGGINDAFHELRATTKHWGIHWSTGYNRVIARDIYEKVPTLCQGAQFEEATSCIETAILLRGGLYYCKTTCLSPELYEYILQCLKVKADFFKARGITSSARAAVSLMVMFAAEPYHLIRWDLYTKIMHLIADIFRPTLIDDPFLGAVLFNYAIDLTMKASRPVMPRSICGRFIRILSQEITRAVEDGEAWRGVLYLSYLGKMPWILRVSSNSELYRSLSVAVGRLEDVYTSHHNLSAAKEMRRLSRAMLHDENFDESELGITRYTKLQPKLPQYRDYQLEQESLLANRILGY